MDQTGLALAFCLTLCIAGIINMHHHGESGSPSFFLSASASLSSILLIPLFIILFYSTICVLSTLLTNWGSFLTPSAARELFPGNLAHTTALC